MLLFNEWIPIFYLAPKYLLHVAILAGELTGVQLKRPFSSVQLQKKIRCSLSSIDHF